ncbi:DoxX family protein [Gordonia aichiensis]|uniref:DoxX family protein n=1 Tax=Gordonia aichiensis NBRC 108223 TaxID=1220583 RepID=L7KKK4_9ACTN|nr:DoxX family protein [Gordonia aichiensis]GAC49001.1 hypothetical protein GOACH_08_00640 [Gordonia aichiensis NBRC 108223]
MTERDDRTTADDVSGAEFGSDDRGQRAEVAGNGTGKVATGNAETGTDEPYDSSNGGGSTGEQPPVGDSASPYDETTGRIPVQQRDVDDRDSFYDRHSRGRMTRVEGLDDLDPDDVHTRPFSATPPSAGRPSSPSAGRPSSPSAGRPSSPSAGRTRRRPAPQRADDTDTERFVSAQRASEPATPDPAPEYRDAGYDEVYGVAEPVTERHDTAVIDAAASDPALAHPALAHPDLTETAAIGDGHGDAGPSHEHTGHGDSDTAAVPRARRGTLDLGLLLLRVAVGVVVMAHGLSHLFGWWNGAGLDGFANELLNTANPAIGFAADAAKPLAAGIALAETIGGLMVIVGLLTPIGASAIVAVMLLAAAFRITTSGGFEFFATANGVEFELMMAAAAAALVLTGPGLYSLDYPRGWARRPFVGSVLWLVVAVAVACVIWIFCNGTDPFTSPGNPR